jgi:ubiquinone/menaquinone biosynthesis C-methylase UbiE
MLEKARENALKGGYTNVEFRKGDAEKMPVEDASADWIISNCVINLSPDKPAVFAESYRVLKSGGQLAISDIMVEDLPDSLRKSAALYTSCVAGAIPEATYLQGLRDAGFVDVAVTERIVYDAEQLLGLVEKNFSREEMDALSSLPLPELIQRHVAGKIWSARITARKP